MIKHLLSQTIEHRNDHIGNPGIGLGQVNNVSEYNWVIGSAGFRTHEALC